MISTISIFFLILFGIFTIPYFTPSGIYIILQKKNNNQNTNLKNLKETYNITTAASLFIMFLVSLTLYLLGCFAPAMIMISFFSIPLFLAKPAVESYDTTKEFIPEKVKRLNFRWKCIILIISIFIIIFGIKINNLDKNISNSEISTSIENYANKNHYIIFPEKCTTTKTGEYIINETSTHYFLIDKNENKIVVYDRINSSNSFETVYDNLLSIDTKQLESKYNDILNNLYLGSNYARICYLINKEDIISVYGLAKKNRDTGNFFISKYVLFNMETGELLELP